MAKQVFLLEGPYDEGGGGGLAVAATARGATEVSCLMRSNDRLYALLEVCKNAIPGVCTTKTRRWDDCKRSTNPYELVHTGSMNSPGVASHGWGMPTSRSFYKMWEMMQDYRVQLGIDRDKPMRAAFLAEGPGGFIEAFARFREGSHVDALYGMTLVLPRNRHVPSWKVSLPSVEVHLHAGDLYDIDDVDAFVAAAGGEGSCDLVTADGGFDFSHDFNAQERTSTRLIMSEIYAAMRLQCDGGHLILKIYDIRTTTTIRMLYMLRRSYHHVRLIKPLTSRPANSEKYVLCTGFRRRERERMLFGPIDYAAGAAVTSPTAPDTHVNPTKGVLGLLRDAVVSGTAHLPLPGAVAAAYAMPSPPPQFVSDVVHFNAHFVTRQAECIMHTLGVAAQQLPFPHATDSVDAQAWTARQWCKKYNVDASPPPTSAPGQDIVGMRHDNCRQYTIQTLPPPT